MDMKVLSLVVLAALIVVNGPIQNAEAAVDISEVCYTCAADYVPGNPVQGNKTLGDLALSSEQLLSARDSDFMSELDLHCMDFHRGTDAERTMNVKIIPEMIKHSPNGSIDGFFIEAGCKPRNFANANSPIAHIAAESPTYRIEHLQIIKKYYKDNNRPEVFIRIINAKNTTGYTTLDYVQHMLENKSYVKVVENGLNQFIRYLCDNGAVYSIYKERRKCDGQHVPVNN